MQNYDYKLNKDDVAERNIIIGVLSVLHKKLYITNYRNDVAEKVTIPFYYSMSGDERYLYDKFMKPLFDNEEKAIGHYNKVPRGVIQYKSSNIVPKNKTNPNVYGKMLQTMEDGTTKTFFAKYRPIPIVMSFDCRIIVNPALDLFKLSEAIKKMLYKNTVFRVDIKRTMIPGIISMPDSIDMEKPIEYNFTDAKKLELSFSFDVYSYIPDFDEKSKLFAGKKMQKGIFHGLYIRGANNTQELTNIGITVPDDREGIINIPKDTNFYHS